MSDGDSIGGVLKDLAKETVKQVVNVPKSIASGAVSQVLKQDSEENEVKKQQEKVVTFQRIKALEAEIAQIRNASQHKKESETLSSNKSATDNTTSTKTKTIDEASRQAVGRAEQGRNFKG